MEMFPELITLTLQELIDVPKKLIKLFIKIDSKTQKTG